MNTAQLSCFRNHHFTWIQRRIKRRHQQSRRMLEWGRQITVWAHVRMFGCEYSSLLESFRSLSLSVILMGPPPPLPLYSWHCTIVHRELKQIPGCCIFDAARALPAHYGVVIQKHSPEGPPHRISLSKACYGYHDLRQRATLHQWVLRRGARAELTKNNFVNIHIWTTVVQK